VEPLGTLLHWEYRIERYLAGAGRRAQAIGGRVLAEFSSISKATQAMLVCQPSSGRIFLLAQTPTNFKSVRSSGAVGIAYAAGRP
jgi:hypothetical protein